MIIDLVSGISLAIIYWKYQKIQKDCDGKSNVTNGENENISLCDKFRAISLSQYLVMFSAMLFKPSIEAIIIEN
ncbi:MAG: hypothetical protein MHPSP_003777, partial [Paramarteilia canceri]